MPKGYPKKKEVIKEPVIETPILSKTEVPNETPKEKKKEAVLLSKCTHGPRCQCQDKLSAGQAYFEDGQTGIHLIGEDNKNEIWWREGNNGKGAWVNRKR